MAKTNCWEYMKCGREQGGAKTAELGVCPASTETRADGVNGGRNSGRSCWAIAETMCGGQVQGAFASKLANCLTCDFYKTVTIEEGSNLVSSQEMISMLEGKG